MLQSNDRGGGVCNDGFGLSQDVDMGSEFDRCVDCLEICASFHGKKFEECVMLKTKIASFNRNWSEATKNHQMRKAGQIVRFPQSMKVQASRQCGARLSSFLLVSSGLRVAEEVYLFTAHVGL